VSDEVLRSFGHRTIGAGEARSVLLRARLDAPIEDVWDACTDPDRLGRWFLPLSGDLREGGTFRLEGHAGGSILVCDPPQRLHVTWKYGDRPADELELHLAVTREGQTVLALEHATVVQEVEWEGTMVDPLPDVAAAWEQALRDGLPRFLAG
jgi:uncharacterized protein YndB with AHSA1/START domain